MHWTDSLSDVEREILCDLAADEFAVLVRRCLVGGTLACVNSERRTRELPPIRSHLPGTKPSEAEIYMNDQVEKVIKYLDTVTGSHGTSSVIWVQQQFDIIRSRSVALSSQTNDLI